MKRLDGVAWPASCREVNKILRSKNLPVQVCKQNGRYHFIHFGRGRIVAAGQGEHDYLRTLSSRTIDEWVDFAEAVASGKI